MTEKLCNGCGLHRPLEGFYRCRAGYLTTPCKACMRARTKQRARANPEYNKQWRRDNPAAANGIRRASYDRHRAQRKAYTKQQRDHLVDAYIRQVLRCQRIPAVAISPALIEAERALILLKRELRKAK